MDRPTCKTCPYYDAEASTVIYPRPTPGQQAGITIPTAIEVKGLCRRDPMGGGHKRPEEWCGEHPRYPEFVTAWTHGEMASGGPATNDNAWQDRGITYHGGSTATASMKDFMAMGITGGPATQSAEPSKPASGEPTEPGPRWVYGGPTEPGWWIAEWDANPPPIINTSIFGTSKISVARVIGERIYHDNHYEFLNDPEATNRHIVRSYGPIPNK